MKVIVDFDGGNAEGIATYGYSVTTGRAFSTTHTAGVEKVVIAEGYGVVIDKSQTSNVAEWAGCLYGMLSCFPLREQITELVLKGDSQLVIRQMTGEYACKAINLRPYYDKCKHLAKHFRLVTCIWNGREHNERTDELTHVARSVYNG